MRYNNNNMEYFRYSKVLKIMSLSLVVLIQTDLWSCTVTCGAGSRSLEESSQSADYTVVVTDKGGERRYSSRMSGVPSGVMSSEVSYAKFNPLGKVYSSVCETSLKTVIADAMKHIRSLCSIYCVYLL